MDLRSAYDSVWEENLVATTFKRWYSLPYAHTDRFLRREIYFGAAIMSHGNEYFNRFITNLVQNSRLLRKQSSFIQ